MDGLPENRFDFSQAPQDQALRDFAPAAPAAASLLPRALDLDEIVRSQNASKTASYCWTIETDEIAWSSNAAEVIGCAPEEIGTGKKFAGLLDSENITSRYDTVMRSSRRDSAGEGVPFEIEYRIRPEGRSAETSVWIEDIGRWYGKHDGSPGVVYGMVRLADNRHKRDQELNFLSNCDALTGMMNRSRMIDALGESIDNATAEKTACAFAILAVNNLSVMNEAYGYEVADEVIVAMAQRLRRVMRVGDGIARYSGSKFGIILNGCKPAELAPALERFMRAVRDSVIETRLGPVWALLSIGAVSLPALGETAEQAIAHAEEALSEAFRLPTDGYVIYTSSEELKAQRMLNARCATEIVSCLRDNLFKLAYQPVVSASSGEILFHEALLRMQDNTGAMITAGHLVPIAESLGLVRLIDRAVVQMGLATLAAYPQARLSINLSATTVTDPRWNVQILDMIAGDSDAASRLLIEVTETAALGSLETSKSFLDKLRDLGCGIAIDDFGAGFTSYRNLKELPITIIKLDGAFCANLANEDGNRIYVKSMLDLAHAFGITVVAEWVETDADAAILRELGVDMIQGNLFGEPSIELPWGEAEAGGHLSESNPFAAPDRDAEAAVPFAAAPDPVMEIAPVAQEASVTVVVEASSMTITGSADINAAATNHIEEMDDSLNLLKQALQELQMAIGAVAPEAVPPKELARAS